MDEGLDHRVREVGSLLVRCSKAADPAARAAAVEREARLLAVVAELSPLPVPAPVAVDAVRGCSSYPKLPGVPLLQLPAARRGEAVATVAPALGRLLSALHAAPLARMAALAEADDTVPAAWRAEAAETYAAVAGHVPAAHRPAIEAFLASAPPAERDVRVFSHGDLGIEHVLVDPGDLAVTGVIDWSDAAIVDPAHDFARILRDLGPGALDRVIDAYDLVADRAELRVQAAYLARCMVFEDLAYGVETARDAYVEKSRAALAWLFPA